MRPALISSPLRSGDPVRYEDLKDLIPDIGKRRPTYATMTAQFVPLAASASQSQQIVTNSEDTDFLVTSISGIATAVDNTTFLTNGPFLLTLRYGSSGQQVTDVGTHFNNLFGSGGLPAELPVPIRIPRRSQFYVIADNLSGTAYNVRLTFRGVRIAAS